MQIRKAEGKSMAQMMEYAEYLAKEIGPRPAGTEEEQHAALYITERFQKDSGFTAQIEEFTCSSNMEMLSAVPGLVVIVVAILSMMFPILSLPAFILAAIATAKHVYHGKIRLVVSHGIDAVAVHQFKWTLCSPKDFHRPVNLLIGTHPS